MKNKLLLILLVLLGMAVAWTGGAGAADDPLTQVRARLENGHLRQAERQLEAFLQRQPDDVEARFLRARLHARQGRLERAIADYEALIKDHPALAEAYNNLAALYVQKGDLEQARLILEQGLETHPAYATLYRNITAVYTEMARRSYTEARLLKGEMKPLELHRLSDLVAPPGGSVAPAE